MPPACATFAAWSAVKISRQIVFVSPLRLELCSSSTTAATLFSGALEPVGVGSLVVSAAARGERSDRQSDNGGDDGAGRHRWAAISATRSFRVRNIGPP
jgi:hypothetical protein